MISNELLEEVIHLSKEGKFIDKGLLIRIAISAIEQLDPITKSKFRDLKIEHLDSSFGLACCDRRQGIILLDYDKLIEQEKEAKVLSYLRANLSIIQYALHEKEHLDEYYKITKNDIQAKLINISSGGYVADIIYDWLIKNLEDKKHLEDILCKKFNNFQEKNWEIIPLEKIAEADSQMSILNSLEAYPDFIKKHPKIYEYFLKEYLYALYAGYEYNESLDIHEAPIFKYLKELRKYGVVIKLEDIGLELTTPSISKPIFTLEDRFKYGFPVKTDSVEKLRTKILKKSNK